MVVFCFAVVATLYFGDALDYMRAGPYYDPGRGTFHAFQPYTDFSSWNTSAYPDADLSGGQYWDSAPNFRAYQALLEENENDRYARNRFWYRRTGALYRVCTQTTGRISCLTTRSSPYFASFVERATRATNVRAAIVTIPPTAATGDLRGFLSEVRRPFTIKEDVPQRIFR